uniref:Sulfhydrogenase 1 subunit delta n=1 Tax=candidate division WOR-3 bacterium TaxID=2052148 RepID=A0A7C4YGD2_UNCW3
MEKPRVGFYGLTGCAGDLLNILNCEDEVVDIFNAVLVKSFVMASSAKDEKSELDIAFVEGSVSTKKDLDDLKEIRKKSRMLIAIGHCATDGGVQSMFLMKNFNERFKNVYGSQDAVKLTKPLEPKPLSAYVKVDYEIPGCPISKEQFLKALGRLILGTIPNLYNTPVCAECKWKENECLLLKGKPCLGPLTRGGCNARCPTFDVPCIGCFGPVDEENYEAHFEYLKSMNIDKEEIIRRFSIFGGTERAEKLKKLLEVEK